MHQSNSEKPSLFPEFKLELILVMFEVAMQVIHAGKAVSDKNKISISIASKLINFVSIITWYLGKIS